MKLIKLFIAIITVILVNALDVLADTKTIREKKDDFVLYNVSGEVACSCKLKIVYNTDEKKFTLSILKPDDTKLDSFPLENPLNYDYFKRVFFEKLKTQYPTIESVSNRSYNAVFSWMYTLNSEDIDDEVTSGILWLKSLVKVSPGLGSTAKDREQLTDSMADEYNAHATLYAYQKQIIVDFLKLNSTSLLDRFNAGIITNMALLDAHKTPNIDSDSAGKMETMFNEYFATEAKLKKVGDLLAANSIYPIKKVSILFERGYLERIQVWVGNKYGGEDIYENIYAIGMSSINNFRNLDRTLLFIRRSTGDDHIFLTDVLGNYDNFLASLTRDYSPADTAINNLSPADNPRIVLRKERILNLFDAKVYTDLAGLRQDAPNGLIQTEVARRFNIHTYRKQILASRQNMGTFCYLNAYGAITKFEDKERELLLHNENIIVNNTLTTPSYVSNLDLRRYENISGGLQLNTLMFDFPDLKFSIYFDIGLRYGHVPILDTFSKAGRVSASEGIKRDAHTLTYELPKITVEVFSERRVNLCLNYQYNITYLYSNYFKQIASYEKSDLTALPIDRRARHMHSVEALLRVETSRNNNGRMFLRTRFFWQRGDANTFFPQIQLGYAYNILFRN